MRVRDRTEITPGALLGLCAMLLWGGDGAKALLVSALCHECGHLLVMKRRSMALQRVRITLLGVSLHYRGGSYTDDALCAAAGPCFSFLLAVCAAMLGQWTGQVRLYTLAGVSAVLGTWNLLPVLPLDGGRILFSLLAPRGLERACTVLRITGAAASGTMCVLGAYILCRYHTNPMLLLIGCALIFHVVIGKEMV